MKVMIDRDGCISCGLCAGTCPEVFQMADDGLAEVYRAPTGENEEQVRMAADGCPLSTSRTEGGQTPEADHGAGTGYGPDPPPAGKKIKIL